MSHPFGDLLSRYLHRKHGLSQAKLATGILQDPSVVAKMCKGQRLSGPQARERVLAIAEWLCTQAAIETLDEANALLAAAGKAPLRSGAPGDGALLRQLQPQVALPINPVIHTSALMTRRTNLPAPLTSFIGRTDELADIEHRIVAQRLVTLTGAGGVGKTRLAIEVGIRLVQSASTFPDGVWLVELADLAQAALVTQALVRCFNLPEQGGQAPLEVLQDALADKHLLLILDNCEHLIDACADVVEQLLHRCWHLHVLATSREELRIAGETISPVLPLSLPDPMEHDPDRLLVSAAAQLFVARMRVSGPAQHVDRGDAATIAHICRQLDGIPLALELAAPLTRSLPLREIADQLGNQMGMLANTYRTAIPRHQTMHSALIWSYRLLGPAEQQLLARVAVFAGGWTLEAAVHVCGETPTAHLRLSLQDLVAKSLVLQERLDGQWRYRLLEPVRQFAHVQLSASGEQDALQKQHADFYLAFAERTAAGLRGPAEREWLDRLESAHDNLRAALQWMLDQGESALGIQLAGALGLFWSWRGYVSEGRMWMRRALAGTDAAPADRARALHALAFYLGLEDVAQAIPLLEESLRLYQAADDTAGIAFALHALGAYRLAVEPDKAAAIACIKESVRLFQTVDEPWGLAYALCDLGDVAYYGQCYDEVGSWCQEGVQVARRLGENSILAVALRNMGWWAEWHEHDPEQAIALYEESLELNRRINNRVGIGDSLVSLGEVTRRKGDYDRAEAHYTAALNLLREDSNRRIAAQVQLYLGLIERTRGNYERAAALSQEALRTIHHIEWLNGYCFAFEGLAGIAAAQGQAHHAVRLLGIAAVLRGQIGFPINPTERPDYDRDVAAAQARLTPSEWEARWAEGQAMGLEQAVAYALDAVTPERTRT